MTAAIVSRLPWMRPQPTLDVLCFFAGQHVARPCSSTPGSTLGKRALLASDGGGTPAAGGAPIDCSVATGVLSTTGTPTATMNMSAAATEAAANIGSKRHRSMHADLQLGRNQLEAMPNSSAAAPGTSTELQSNADVGVTAAAASQGSCSMAVIDCSYCPNIHVGGVIELGDTMLGEGTSAKVMLGKLRQAGGTGSTSSAGTDSGSWAVKVFKQRDHKPRVLPYSTTTVLDAATLECRAAHLLAKCADLFAGPLAAGYMQGSGERCLVMKACSKSLADVLDKHGPMSAVQVCGIMRQLLQRVDVLHTGLDGFICIHRDIKPDNILVDEDGTTLRLADFGCCTVDRKPAGGGMPTQHFWPFGSMLYQPPEVRGVARQWKKQQQAAAAAAAQAKPSTWFAKLGAMWKAGQKSVETPAPEAAAGGAAAGGAASNPPAPLRGYGSGFDVFSAGVTGLVLLAGGPFVLLADPGETPKERVVGFRAAIAKLAKGDTELLSLPIQAALQDNLAEEFFRMCCCPDPDSRPTAKQLLQHPWLKTR